MTTSRTLLEKAAEQLDKAATYPDNEDVMHAYISLAMAYQHLIRTALVVEDEESEREEEEAGIPMEMLKRLPDTIRAMGANIEKGLDAKELAQAIMDAPVHMGAYPPACVVCGKSHALMGIPFEPDKFCSAGCCSLSSAMHAASGSMAQFKEWRSKCKAFKERNPALTALDAALSTAPDDKIAKHLSAAVDVIG